MKFPPFLALIILNCLFFMISLVRSTTPPFSPLVPLTIFLSSKFLPIANDIYKNLCLMLSSNKRLLQLPVLEDPFSLVLLPEEVLIEFFSFLFFDKRILLNLFIFDNTLFLLLNISSDAPGKITCVSLINIPDLSISYILLNFFDIFFKSLYVDELYFGLMFSFSFSFPISLFCWALISLFFLKF